MNDLNKLYLNFLFYVLHSGRKDTKKKDHFLLASDPKTFYKLNKVTIDFSECWTKL